jgi:hypothetical protein
MTNIVEWPIELKAHADFMPFLERNTQSGGRSVTGSERLVISDTGTWRYGITTMSLTPIQTLAFRAMLANSEGRGYPIRVPVWDKVNDLLATSGMESLRGLNPNGGPFDDGSFFSDGTGFGSDFATATANVFATFGTTQITASFNVGQVPLPGHFFSDNTNLYQIKSAILVSGTRYTLNFLPRLRTSLNVGAVLNFEKLFFLGRLADESMAKIQRYPGPDLHMNLEFVEYTAS